MPAPFHLAVPVHSLEAARTFYGDLLGCPEGRSAERWIDFDLYGHQFVVHLVEADPHDRRLTSGFTWAKRSTFTRPFS